jgi:hypothetical protein
MGGVGPSGRRELRRGKNHRAHVGIPRIIHEFPKKGVAGIDLHPIANDDV